MQYHPALITADRAYNCPVGRIRTFLSALETTNRRLVDLTDVIPAVEDANSKLVDVVVLSDADIQGF